MVIHTYATLTDEGSLKLHEYAVCVGFYYLEEGVERNVEVRVTAMASAESQLTNPK